MLKVQEKIAMLDHATDVLHGLNVRERNYLIIEPPVPMTYRVVVSTQVHENYAWCDWDGQDECPQRWKAKGGHDYIVAEGLDEKAMMTTDAADYAPDTIEHRSDGFREEIVDIRFVSTEERTYEEMMVYDMMRWGYLKQAEADRIINDAKRYLRK